MDENIDSVVKIPGMGAILGSKVVTFRVWAPHADKVYVTGTFNDWSDTATPLIREENGFWAADARMQKQGMNTNS